MALDIALKDGENHDMPIYILKLKYSIIFYGSNSLSYTSKYNVCLSYIKEFY